MSNISKIKTRAIIQYILVIAVVFVVGMVERYKEERNCLKEELAYSNSGLPVAATPRSDYPEIKLGSEKAWRKYIESSKNQNIFFEGEGKISEYSVTIDMLLEPDGSLIGRYHNANGTNLDLNGYVDPTNGDIHIHLGHASDKTLSKLDLSPKESNNEKGIYIYEGTWGKKEKPSRLTLQRKDS